MVRRAKTTLARIWAYVVVIILIAVPCLGTCWWSHQPLMEWEGPFTDAIYDPSRGEYWVPHGEKVALWLDNLVDEDEWQEGSNGGTAADVITENNVTWSQVNGVFLEVDNNNNNNNNCPAPGHGRTVWWEINCDYFEGCVSLASVLDTGYMPPGDEPYPDGRKDGPIVNGTGLLFLDFRILGPDMLWYWGANPDVSILYRCKNDPNYPGYDGVSYGCTKDEHDAYYQWDATFPLRIRKDMEQEWKGHLEGEGLSSVMVKFVEREEPISGGWLSLSCKDAEWDFSISTQKYVAKRMPAYSEPLNWESDDGKKIIDAVFERSYTSARHVGKHYDEDVRQEVEIGDSHVGYTTLVGYHLCDTTEGWVPYYYWYYEYFTDTHSGNGHTIFPGENWTWTCGDGEIGGTADSGPYETHDSIWVDHIRQLDSPTARRLFPTCEYPHMPTRSGIEVQWAGGEWRFGQRDELDTAVLAEYCNYVAHRDCGRHN